MLAAELISLAIRARKAGKLSAARECYAGAAKIHRDQNDRLAYAHAIRHIADMHCDESHFAEATPIYEESLEIYRSHLDTKLLDLANTVRPYALVQERQGNFDQATQSWQEAKVLYASLRIEAAVHECDAHLTEIVRTRMAAG